MRRKHFIENQQAFFFLLPRLNVVVQPIDDFFLTTFPKKAINDKHRSYCGRYSTRHAEKNQLEIHLLKLIAQRLIYFWSRNNFWCQLTSAWWTAGGIESVTFTWGPWQFCESTTLIRICQHFVSESFESSFV